jgi:hypothetical protein
LCAVVSWKYLVLVYKSLFAEQAHCAMHQRLDHARYREYATDDGTYLYEEVKYIFLRLPVLEGDG